MHQDPQSPRVPLLRLKDLEDLDLQNLSVGHTQASPLRNQQLHPHHPFQDTDLPLLLNPRNTLPSRWPFLTKEDQGRELCLPRRKGTRTWPFLTKEDQGRELCLPRRKG